MQIATKGSAATMLVYGRHKRSAPSLHRHAPAVELLCLCFAAQASPGLCSAQKWVTGAGCPPVWSALTWVVFHTAGMKSLKVPIQKPTAALAG